MPPSTRIREHIRSNAVGYVALFAFAMSGSASALTGSDNIDHNDLQAHVVHRSKIHDAAVNSSKVADSSLTGADLAADEPPHVVGAAGEPAFGNGGTGDCPWQASPAPFNPVSFYLGKDGRVHLAGLPGAQNGPGEGCGPELGDARIFTLPPAYRPANVEQFTSSSCCSAEGPPDPALVLIGADQNSQIGDDTIPAGAVMVFAPVADHPQGVALDGIDFRAAGTGGF